MALDNIVTLAGRFKSTTELKEYCDAQFLALSKALERIKELEGEVFHLQELLTGTTPLIDKKVGKFVVSDEQAICEIAIKRLKDTTKERQLTLEEAKQLDLFVKNLYLIKSKSVTIAAESRPVEPADDAALVALAKTPDLDPKPREEDGTDS